MVEGKERKINKLRVNGVDQPGNILPAEATKNQKTVQVHIFTEEATETTVPSQESSDVTQ